MKYLQANKNVYCPLLKLEGRLPIKLSMKVYEQLNIELLWPLDKLLNIKLSKPLSYQIVRTLYRVGTTV